MRRRTLAVLVLLLLAGLLLLVPRSPGPRERSSPALPTSPGTPSRPPAVPPVPAAGPSEPARAVAGVVGATRYLVLDPDGRPVQGARLWEDADGSAFEFLLGETGAEGTLPISPAKGPRLIARAAGFVAWRGEPASLPVVEGARVLRLARGATLRGHLVDREGRPLSVSGTVAAWSEEDEKTAYPRQFLGSRLEGALVATVETDETGQFSFEGADPDAAYHLVGGAKGMIFAGPREGIVARVSDPDTPIPLEPLYAVVARLRDSDGGPMEINWENPSGASIGVSGMDREGYLVADSGGMAARMAARGLPDQGLSVDGTYVVVWLFRQVPGPHGPLQFHFKAPAYGHSGVEAGPEPVVDGLRETPVTMERLVPRAVRGSLRIRFDLSPLGKEVREAMGERSTFMVRGQTVHLLPEPPGSGGRERTKPIPFPLPEEFVVDDVEPGTYRVRLHASKPTVPTSVAPEMVFIEGKRETSCTVKILAAQCLALEVTDPDGRPHKGVLQVTMLSGPEFPTEHGLARRGTTGAFLESPYLLHFSDEGPVELRVTADGCTETVATPTVAPGSVTRCSLRLERK